MTLEHMLSPSGVAATEPPAIRFRGGVPVVGCHRAPLGPGRLAHPGDQRRRRTSVSAWRRQGARRMRTSESHNLWLWRTPRNAEMMSLNPEPACPNHSQANHQRRTRDANLGRRCTTYGGEEARALRQEAKVPSIAKHTGPTALAVSRGQDDDRVAHSTASGGRLIGSHRRLPWLPQHR